MIKRLLTSTVVVLAAASSLALAQNTNSSQTMRPRTAEPTSTPNKSTAPQKSAPPQKSTDVQQPATTPPAARRIETKPKVAETPGSQGLILFNSNGTVTKGWEQLRKNRESAYRDAKDVKLDVRDVSITMLGRDGAVVSCLWTQSQNYKGAPETATGRMTLVFKHIGKDWKVIHLHTSPDRPDPSRVLPSEQVPAATSSPTP